MDDDDTEFWKDLCSRPWERKGEEGRRKEKVCREIRDAQAADQNERTLLWLHTGHLPGACRIGPLPGDKIFALTVLS